MSNEPETEVAGAITPKRLWFGFAGGGVAWALAGIVNALLAWQACMGGEAGSLFFTQTGVRIVFGVITVALLATAAAAGWISYRNWRTLSEKPDLMHAEGRGRQEFMAIFGLVVSVSLGVGIVWFLIPIYIIRMCVRAH
jgi:hypothetical protein